MPLAQNKNTPLKIFKTINRNILSALRAIGLDFTEDEPKPALENKERKREPKPKPPEEIEIPDPPQEDPPNRIERPPRQIYPDSPIAPYSYVFIFVPTLPRRILPDANKVSTDTERSYTSAVGDKLIDHIFGCLLARPYYSKPIEFCLAPTQIDFWNQLNALQEIKANQLIEDLENGNTENALDKGFIYLSLPEIDYPVQIRSVEAIELINNFYFARSKNIANYPRTGMISLGGIEITECEPQKISPSREDFELINTNDFNTVGIPLSLYDDNFGAKGDQVQLIFKNSSLKSQYRQITIPFAKDIIDYTFDQIKAITPTEFTFGHTIQMIKLTNSNNNNLARHGIMKIFTNNDDTQSQKDFVNNFVANLVANFCLNNINISYARASSYIDKLDPNTDTYPIDKVVFLGYGEDDKKWITKQQWYLA